MIGSWEEDRRAGHLEPWFEGSWGGVIHSLSKHLPGNNRQMLFQVLSPAPALDATIRTYLYGCQCLPGLPVSSQHSQEGGRAWVQGPDTGVCSLWPQHSSLYNVDMPVYRGCRGLWMAAARASPVPSMQVARSAKVLQLVTPGQGRRVVGLGPRDSNILG